MELKMRSIGGCHIARTHEMVRLMRRTDVGFLLGSEWVVDGEEADVECSVKR